MSLPTRLLTSIVWKSDGETTDTTTSNDNHETKPDLAIPVFQFDPQTEEPIRLSEAELIARFTHKEKRRRLAVQSTPATPASRYTDVDDDDDSASVFSRDEDSAATKWPFEEVSQKLRAAAWEVHQMSEALRTNETVVVRVERTPQSKEEQKASLELGLQKRMEAFKKSEEILKKGIENLEKEVKNQRDFVGKLSRIAEKWRLVAPGHSTTVMSSLKPDEHLAINLETGGPEDNMDDLILIHRTNPSHGGIAFSTLDGKSDSSGGEFKAHGVIAKLFSAAPPFKVLGQASTVLGSVVDEDQDLSSMPLGRMVVVDDHVSLDNRIEARFKDAHARVLIRRLHSKEASNEIRLGREAVLKFELVPDEKPFGLINSNDAICSVALNLLERGKSADEIRLVCLQKLMFPKFVETLGRTPGATSIVWRTDEDDEDKPSSVCTRCCIDIGRAGKHAMEFALFRGELTFEWCTVPGYKPKLARPLVPDEALEVASEVAVMALVRDLIDMVTAMKDDSFAIAMVKANSFQIANGLSSLANVTVKVSCSGSRLLVQLHFEDGRPVKDVSDHPFHCLRRVLLEQRGGMS